MGKSKSNTKLTLQFKASKDILMMLAEMHDDLKVNPSKGIITYDEMLCWMIKHYYEIYKLAREKLPR